MERDLCPVDLRFQTSPEKPVEVINRTLRYSTRRRLTSRRAREAPAPAHSAEPPTGLVRISPLVFVGVVRPLAYIDCHRVFFRFERAPVFRQGRVFLHKVLRLDCVQRTE